MTLSWDIHIVLESSEACPGFHLAGIQLRTPAWKENRQKDSQTNPFELSRTSHWTNFLPITRLLGRKQSTSVAWACFASDPCLSCCHMTKYYCFQKTLVSGGEKGGGGKEGQESCLFSWSRILLATENEPKGIESPLVAGWVVHKA